MKRFKQISAVAVLLGVVGLWTAFAQGTGDLTLVDKVGWWTRRAGAQPTGNPANFEVAAGVQGDESIAALRVLIRGDVTSAKLVLGEADAPFKDLTTPKLRVCTTTVPWIVVDGGTFDAAPKPDCSNAAELTRTKDPAGNGSWAADVTAFVAGARSEVTLMVVPAPDPSAVLPPTYWIKFLARVDATGTPDVQPSGSPTPPPPTVNSAPRVTSAPTGTAAPVVTAPPATAAASNTVTTEPAKRFAVPVASKGEKKPWGRLFFLIPLSVLLAAFYTGGRKVWEQRLEGATN